MLFRKLPLFSLLLFSSLLFAQDKMLVPEEIMSNRNLYPAGRAGAGEMGRGGLAEGGGGGGGGVLIKKKKKIIMNGKEFRFYT
jgi:hypothetical protein